MAKKTDSGGWNHRVMRHRYGPPSVLETLWEIHEVYYNDDGKIFGWTESPCGVTAESPSDLREILEQMLKALDQPVLDYDMKLEGDCEGASNGKDN